MRVSPSVSALSPSTASHLSELAEELTAAFGGTRALAQTLRDLANDREMPDWLRTRAYSIVVNTISAASKLDDAKAHVDVELLSDEDLRQEAMALMRETLGIRDGMDPGLATVVGAWPELPEAARAGILAGVRASVPIGDPDQRENDLETPDTV